MKDLHELVLQVFDDMNCDEIPYSKNVTWEINTRAKTRWGNCHKNSDGTFTIQISSRLLNEEVDDMATKNTIAHELIHTCPGCMNHGDNFKRYASWLNMTYGYNIKRCTSSEEKGIEEVPKKVTYRYIIHCASCGRNWKYQKKSKLVSLIMDNPRHGCKCPCGDTKHLMAWELKK